MIATFQSLGVSERTIRAFVNEARLGGNYGAKEILDWLQHAIPSHIGQMILLRALWYLDGMIIEHPGWSTAIFDQERTER